MFRTLLLAMALAVVTLLKAQSPSLINAVQLSATVQSAPAAITLSWASLTGTTGFTIYRKLKSSTTWGGTYASVAGTATQWTDNAVALGTYYEYKVVRTASGGTGYGYIAAGIEVPATEYNGKIILLVDNSMAASIATQLQQLQTDLKADGWTVLRQDVSRTASVTSIRSIITNLYNADPTNVKAVYLVGHVPVPYSGNLNPDGHSAHLGAWPCDGYYADVNGTWTDNSVTSTGGYTYNWNTPGDGRFDQSDYPSALELQVGRVDLQDMPAFAQSEPQLLAAYLDKAHAFKTKQWVPQTRGIVFDNLQWVSNPLAGCGYRSIAALVGHQNITDCYPYGAAFTTFVSNQSYLWTYASGGGLQAVDNNVLTFNGANNIATTQDYATTAPLGGVFNMSFGSYFGDWDNRNNFLRAQLASGQALTSVWAAIPNWWFHHMGLGDHIGYSAFQSMNNGSIYTPQNSGWQGATYGRAHLGLMGDPTLRMMAVAPPTNLQVTNAGGNASFSWTASSDAVLGYYIYQIDQATGAVSRVVPTMVTSTSFLSPTVPFIAGKEYMVRAVKLQTTTSGSYYNLSLGAIATATGAAGPDCLGVVGGPALPGTACNDGNACTVNDVYTASCQCAGTASGDTDGDGVCNATDNCPGVAGQIGSACSDGNACTINDVLNANCQCVGTAAADSDGDGVCNTLDNCPNVAGQIGSACNDGNACTINDVLNASCQCAGTFSGDTDGDGLCNATDNCPNVAGQIGSACNDGNACTGNDVLNASCQCLGTYSGDTDGDGICNATDNCPTVAGQVGSPCNDGDPCTINDVLNSGCQCIGTASGDSDGDGICNAQDNCPNVAGQIGSSCNDGNPCTLNDLVSASCQCVGTLSPDSDGDGTCNVLDGCPNDPLKLVPGNCGCGAAEPGSACNDGNAATTNDVIGTNCQCTGTVVNCDDGDPCTIDSFNGTVCVHMAVPDGDGDGLCDLIDPCPSGPNPGLACNDNNACTINDVVGANCTCAGTFADTDGDGTCNANDGCPNDPNKVAPGACGCGVSDVDADGDGAADCVDLCPLDPAKTAPGSCGCGAPEPGAACTDGNASTINDVIGTNCQCAGTLVTFDCLGTPNGSALPGTACNDGNANTINDVFDANCQCTGTYVTVDCAGVVNGTASLDNCGTCVGGTTGLVACTQDCNGVYGGTASMDACGICAGGNTGITPNSTCTDCAGVVNGTASLDNCGTCVGGTTGLVACAQDCNGVYGGTAAVDACGICSGGTTGITPNSTCTDCAGVVNGTASFDNCGTCVGGTTGLVACAQDCNGVYGGTAAVDACGSCAGGTTGIMPNSSCTDCAGVVNGTASLDNCGTCVGGTTGLVACTQDCNGVYGGTASMDACGICAGGNTGITPNSSCTDCAGVVNGTASLDNCGTCVGGTTGLVACAQDCNGVYGGTAAVDACGICSGGTTGITPNSTCTDCAGVVNGTASLDNCGACVGGTTGLVACTQDCNGVYGGTASMDACGICAGGTTGITPNSTCTDCAGVVNGTAAVDACGVCAGGTTGITPNSTCTDCAGVVNGTASLDNCGTCVGGTTGLVACAQDCNGVYGGTASMDACGICAGGTTGITPNSTCTDCAGVVNGTASLDNCGTCVGGTTGLVACTQDCNGVYGGTASMDACGICAGGTTGIMPNSTCTDCAGVVNGTASLDNCGTCVGGTTGLVACTQDCNGVYGGAALPGTACNDNDPNTGNDHWNLNCQCVGQVIDCMGVAGGTALPGTPCNDGNGGTQGDLWSPNCDCIGNSVGIDCTGTPGGTALPGTSCDDGDALTAFDSWTVDCTCAGVAVDCAGVVGGTAVIDGCGICAGGTTGLVPDADEDGDGLAACEDICPNAYDPGQADFDGDGVGDACDNCAWVSNADQADANGNGIGDACETMNGISEPGEGNGLVFFPNPVRDQLHITCTNARVRSLRMVDLAGQLVLETQLLQRLDMSSVAQGTYIIIALDAEGRPLAQTRLIRQ